MSDVDRRPTAITLKALLGLGWSPVAFGIIPLPGSLRDGPDIYGQISAVTVVAGCAVSIVGLILGMRNRQPEGLNAEALGLAGVFLGCVMYAIALASVPRPRDAVLAIGITVAVAGFAGVQRWMIRRKLKRDKLAPAGVSDES